MLWGCTTVPQQLNKVEDWSVYSASLQQLTTFNAAGKLGYISHKNRVSLNFHWKQNSQGYVLRLSTFLGGNILQLTVNAQGAFLVDDKGKTHYGHSAGDLIYQLTGLVVPVDQIKDWIKGLPTGADNYQLDAFHRVQTLNKDQQWTARYSRYQNTDKMVLPKDILLQQMNNKTKIKIMINTWEL